MTQYVLGFCFNRLKDEVLLINKLRPDWQIGKLNGLGGKVEKGEIWKDAMIREFKEECGLVIEEWIYKIHITRVAAEVIIFTAIARDLYAAESLTDEEIQIVDVSKLPKNVLPNLRYLIPLCADDNINHVIRINYV
jgi:8-oxo-dGTP diphosphatase